MSYFIKKVLRQLWANVWRWIGVPLISAILGTAVIGRLIDAYVRPESYKVYVVGDFANDDVNRIWKGINQGDLEIDGIKVRLQKFNGKITNPPNLRKPTSN